MLTINGHGPDAPILPYPTDSALSSADFQKRPMTDSEKITPLSHPLHHGQIFFSPGCHFSYRVIGPCCRLFDREQLPYPCCRIQWRGKEPSWRRIGKRFVVDLATRTHPSYSVEILGQGSLEPVVITLYSVTLPQPLRDWWHSDKLRYFPDLEVIRENLRSPTSQIG
jgi:hypothetical protein